MTARSFLAGPFSRALSLAAAAILSLALMIYPYALGHTMDWATHMALPVLLFGVSGAFVHGIGYEPDNRFLRALFGAPVAWLLIALGIALLLIRRV
jgi:predicted membrane protein